MNGKLFCKVNSALLFISIILGFSNYLLSPSSVFAASSAFNKQINYQGKLTDSSSVTVTDGDYNMEFKIYTTSSGGSPIWTETRTGTDKVTITSGLFSVLLGSVTSLASLNYNQDLYLSVNIGGTGAASWDGEMTPRKRFGTVPSAFEADKIDGLDSSQLVRSDDSNTIASSSASTLLGLTQLGGGNVFEASSTAGALFVVRNAGNVGIGTTSPYAAFSVVGSTGVVADNFTATGTQFVSSFQQILANSSSTLQNFTAILSTTTSATTTSLGVSGTASSSALVVSGNASSTTLLGNLSVTGTAGFNRLYLTGATSTFASGLNLSAGCFAVNGTCIGGSNLTGSGAANRAAFWTAAGNLSYDDTFVWDNTNKRLGIGTSTPGVPFAVAGRAIIDDNLSSSYFTATSSTATSTFAGIFGVGTSTPAFNPLFVVGTSSGPFLYVDKMTGNVGVNSVTAGERLEVVGNIISKGTLWTSRTSATDNNWRGVTYGNGLFVAVSDSGVGDRVMTSPDGINWTSRTPAADSTWRGVGYGNGLFVALGLSGTIMTSPDGITWTSRTSPTTNNWEPIAYGNGTFVAVLKVALLVTRS